MPTFKWGWCGAVALTFSICASLPALAGDGYGKGYAVGTTYSTVFVSGSDFTRNSDEYYSGFYHAFNRDLSRDGFLGRVLGVRGFYEYDETIGLGTERVHANYWAGDVMLGYQWVRGGTDIVALLGVEYQDHSLSNSASDNPLTGSEVGFKAALEIESNGTNHSPWYYALRGSYSTAFDSYYALARVGHKMGRFTVGPEGWVLGNEAGDAQRLGAFIAWDMSLGRDTLGNVSLSVGHQFSDDDDGFGRDFEEGVYATVKFWLAFK